MSRLTDLLEGAARGYGRIQGSFDLGKKQVAPGMDLVIGSGGSRVSVDQWTADYTIAAAVYANDLVAAALDFLMTQVSEAPFGAWDGVPNKSEFLEDHPFSLAFEDPNARDSQQDFWRIVVGELGHAEEGAFTVAVLDRAEDIEAIWPKSGDEVRIIKDERTFIGGYELKKGNTWVRATDAERVAWVRIAGPRAADQWVSWPPLKSAREAIRMDTDMGRWLGYILKNMGKLTALVGIDDPNMTREVALEVQETLNQRYGGPTNAGKIGVAAGKISSIPLGLDFASLDFGAVKDRMELAVARAFGVPAELLQVLVAVTSGDGFSGGSKYRELVRIAYNNKIIPLAKMIAGKMGDTYADLYGVDPKQVGFDFTGVEALADELDAQYERTRIAEPFTTPNERREMVGFEKIDQEGADEIGTLKLVGAFSSEPEEEPEEDDDLKLKAREVEKVARFLTREEKATEAEEAFERIALRLFGKEADGVSAAIRAGSLDPTDAINVDAWMDAYGGPMFDVAIKAGTAEVLTSGASMGGLQTRAAQSAAQQALKLAGEVTDTSTAKVLEFIAKGTEAGLGTDEIARQIAEEVGPYGTKNATQRARTIARTETVGAVERGSLDGAREAAAQGFEVQKEWLTSMGENVRPLHTDAQTLGEVPLEHEYGILGPAPGMSSDPSQAINCRCTLLFNYEAPRRRT